MKESQEIEDPELATKRTRMLYKLKGYPESWSYKNECVELHFAKN